MRTIAVLTALYLVWEVLTYLAGAVGSATLAEAAGPPPFLLGLFWAVLGFRLWRHARTAR